MHSSSDAFDIVPAEIARFERCWLLALTLNAFVGVLVLPRTAGELGLLTAVLANLSLFAVGALLMLQVCRGSNGARWVLALPFNSVLALFDVSQWVGLPAHGPDAMVIPLHLGAAIYATFWLFAPACREWFAGTAAWRARQA